MNTATDVRRSQMVVELYERLVAGVAAVIVAVLPFSVLMRTRLSGVRFNPFATFYRLISFLVRGAGNTLFKRRELSPKVSVFVASATLLGMAAYLGVGSWSAVMKGPDKVAGTFQFDIEVQDFAGGREVGLWAKQNAPPDAKFMTIDPSMGNIIRFYGQKQTVALSISADPRKRNPAYLPIANPDILIRNLGVHYLVWDAYSANRSAFYNARLMRYVRKYDGVPVFAVYQKSDGTILHTMNPSEDDELRVIVFDVHGGGPLNTQLSYPLTNSN